MFLLSARGFRMFLVGFGLLLGLVRNCSCDPKECYHCEKADDDCNKNKAECEQGHKYCYEKKTASNTFMKGCTNDDEYTGSDGCKDFPRAGGGMDSHCWCQTDLCNKDLHSKKKAGGNTPGSNAGSTMNTSLIPVIASGLLEIWLGLGFKRITLF